MVAREQFTLVLLVDFLFDGGVQGTGTGELDEAVLGIAKIEKIALPLPFEITGILEP